MIAFPLQSCELSVSMKEHLIKKEKWGRTIDFVTRLFNLPLICLETEKLFLGSSKKMNLFHNYYKESYPLLRRIYVTCKLQNQPLGRVTSTVNCFF